MFIGDLTTRNDFVKELFSVYLADRWNWDEWRSSEDALHPQIDAQRIDDRRAVGQKFHGKYTERRLIRQRERLERELDFGITERGGPELVRSPASGEARPVRRLTTEQQIAPFLTIHPL